MGAWRGVQVGVGVFGLAYILATSLIPYNSPVPPHETTTPTATAVDALVGLVWLAAILVARARQPGSPLWKLMLAFFVLDQLWTLTHIPDEIVRSTVLLVVPLYLALFVHVLVAFPSGHLRSPFDRRLVGLVYALIVGTSVVHALTWDLVYDPPCVDQYCPRNVFVIWPNDAVDGLVTRTAELAAPFLGLVVIYAVWRHWRGAGPVARRALLPVIVALPVWYLRTSLDYLSSALQIEPLFIAVRQPWWIAIDVIIPAGLLLGVLRLQLDRGRVANLMVELGRGIPTGGLRDALARALGDPTLRLAFVGPDPATYIDPSGHPVDLPTGDPSHAAARIERDGELVAVLIHDPTIDDEDPGLIEAVGTAARFAIDNERLTAQVRAQLEEVRASRVRIIEAADAERRRVERDLHDGAQQRLVALAMRLQVAREASGSNAVLIDEATAELEAAIGEVRDLARGVHPPILTEAGLRAAIETLAERSPVPVRIEATEARYPLAVETTAYYVVSEALTNTARYGGATEATVSLSSDGRRLIVTVADDGRGGADPERGSGLRGLADRVAALGGQLDVSSPLGGGTTITAALPLG